MSICPDNSTECLLRSLLDAQPAFNWDPITFAFTAAIGIVAVAVAVTAVFQGVLAAGPGRLKASEGAIGPWSSLNKIHFDWRDFRYRTVAQVPCFRLEEYFAATAQDENEDRVQVRVKPKISGHPAGWLSLLEDTSLQDMGMPTAPCFTDYLPADIAAAPAYAEVACIFILGAIAGCDFISSADPYVHARGGSSQVRMYEHPSLGLMISYEQFLSKPTYRSNRKSQTFSAISEGIGLFSYGTSKSIGLSMFTKPRGHSGSIIEDLRDRSGQCGHSTCAGKARTRHFPFQVALVLLAANSPTARVTPHTRLKMHETLRRLSRLSEPWKSAEQEQIIGSVNSILDGIGGQVHTVNTFTFAGFPLFGDRVEDRTAHVAKRYTESEMGECSRWWSWLPTTSPKSGRPRPKWPSSVAATKEDIVIVWLALETCLDWIEDSSSIVYLEERKRSLARTAIQIQLQEIDWWLLNHGGSKASCHTRQLFDEYEKTASNADQPTMSSTASTPTALLMRGNETMIASQEGWRSILLYRAALFATLCATGADSSLVVETELGRRVVRFL